MQHAVTIELFGGLRVRYGTQVIERFRSQKTAALLAYLACHGRMHTREKLADILWPDSPPQAARASLCVALSSLRSQLEPPGVSAGSVLLADRNSIGLPAGVEIDLRSVTDLLDRADRLALDPTQTERTSSLRRQAVTLFRDDLLSSMYEQWVTQVQLVLNARVADALVYLAGQANIQGDDRAAEGYVQQALSLHPCCQVPASLMPTDAPDDTAGAGPGGAPREQAMAGTPPPREKSGSGRKSRAQSALPLWAPEDATPAPPASVLSTLPRFFGRRAEYTGLCELLADESVRLVTLTGMGGIGKTRLAWNVLKSAGSIRPGCRTVFVSAAGLRDVSHLPACVADAWGLPETADGDAGAPGGGGSPARIFGRIVSHIKDGRSPVLLIMDNFETVAAGGDTFVTSLLAATPLVTCLITSRVPLQCDGEREVRLGPLPVPPPDEIERITAAGADTPERLAVLLDNWPALAFFVDRATLAHPAFRFSAHNAHSVQELVARLEGIPLAIELAAARSQTHTPRQMVEQLDQRFAFLVNRQRMLRPSDRHSSLGTTIAWSYEELPEASRALLRALSVFRGGCRADVIAGIVEGDELADLPACLDTLCRSSLLTREADPDNPDNPRFILLDTIREYAEAEVSAEDSECLRMRHARALARLAEKAEPQLQTPDSARWLRLLDTEQSNLQAAFHWASAAQTRAGAETALSLATSLHRYWLCRGRIQEGREWLRAALGHPCGGKWDPAREAVARNRAGILASNAGDVAEAEEHYEATLAMRRAAGNRRGIAATLNNLAILASKEGRLEEAYKYYEESLAIWRGLDEARNVSVVLANLGVVAGELGLLDDAMARFAESIPLARLSQNPRSVSVSLRNWGEVAYRHGDMSTSESLFLESLETFDAMGDVQSAAYSLLGIGAIAWHRRHERRATRLLSASIAAFEAFGLPLPSFCADQVARAREEGLNLPSSDVGGTIQGRSTASGTSEALQTIKVLTQVILDSWEESGSVTQRSSSNDTASGTFLPTYSVIKG